MKKRMILALVLVFALLCLACSNDADDGTNSFASESSLTSEQSATSESSASSSVSSADSTSSADETSGETSAESDTSSETSGTTSADGTSGDTSSGTESSATSSDASTSSKPAENSESNKPAENSKPTEGSKNSDTSSGSSTPSKTAHTHNYKTTVVKPTCTENGYTLHKCSCGDSYKDNEVPATGHEMGYWTVRNVKECSYSEPGIKERPCNRCGEWLVDDEYYHYWAPPVNDEEEVYRRIIALQEIYPDWSVWDDNTYYDARYDAWGNLIQRDDTEPYAVTNGYGSADACMGFAAMVSNTVFGVFWNHKTLPKGTFTIKDVRVGDLVYYENHVEVVLEVFDDHISTVGGNGGGKVYWYGYMDRDYLESSCYIETRYDPECF